eukprot:TRINITY_DN2552_c0_g1_i2.p1 TRINITY_DN2552_c0_g1~~TRINITY_DN2552_c0_g1_i2.p1  ORF type:complete len:845 (-),score=122.30 TRINITY_DN2552_c0_g1_i2:110-2644(-)
MPAKPASYSTAGAPRALLHAESIEGKEGNGTLDHWDYRELSNFYAQILKSCVKSRSLRRGKAIHASILKEGMDWDIYLHNSLISMYIKLQKNMEGAEKLFGELAERDVATWTAMISGYAKCGMLEKAFQIFVKMQEEGIQPNQFTFTTMLRASRIDQVRQIHGSVLKTEFKHIVTVGNVLIDAYASCEKIEFARQVFDEMICRSSVSWNTLIAGYAGCGLGTEATNTFVGMRESGFQSDEFSFSSALTGVSQLGSLRGGQQIHALIIRSGFESNLVVCNSLVSMYGTCGCVESASKVFSNMSYRDSISWTNMLTAYSRNGDVDSAFHLFKQLHEPDLRLCNSLISGFVQNGEGEKAFRLFRRMLQVGINVDHFTVSSVLEGSADLSTELYGKQLHGYVIKSGFESSAYVRNAVLAVYVKRGSILDAELIFRSMPERDQVSWTTMISGYSQNGEAAEALNLFRQMQHQHEMDNVAIAAVIGACSALGASDEGKQLHAYTLRHGFCPSLEISNALINMYSKCGILGYAFRIFGNMNDKDVCSWNTMIGGCAQNALGREALQLFQEMQKQDIRPDAVTFLAVLFACKSLGLVSEGFTYFHSMTEDYGISPSSLRYASMVHILGSVGKLDEAQNFVNNMPTEPDAAVYHALFRAARAYCNVQIAKHAAEKILALEPTGLATYVLQANICASVGWFDAAREIRRRMKGLGIWKTPAHSWMFCGRKIHHFMFRHRTHPQIEEIHGLLKELVSQARDLGYRPDTSFVTHDVEPYHKENFLTHHSAKLVVAFGILNAPPGAPIKAFKNVCICGDCHTFIKYVSTLVKREIVIRDPGFLHRFKDGVCSCGDYW